jgi:hypothetical protein
MKENKKKYLTDPAQFLPKYIIITLFVVPILNDIVFHVFFTLQIYIIYFSLFGIFYMYLIFIATKQGKNGGDWYGEFMGKPYKISNFTTRFLDSKMMSGKYAKINAIIIALFFLVAISMVVNGQFPGHH